MSEFEKCLSLAEAHGLYLDKRVVRKKVDDLYGMYATKRIAKGTKIASFPKSNLLPIPDPIPNDCLDAKWLISVARELAKGADSKFEAHCMLLETVEDMKEYSAYYFTDSEIDTLTEMSPILGRFLHNFINGVNYDIARVRKHCPDVSEEILQQAVLNGRSRHWGAVGFVPILDCFNHSEKLGIPLRSSPADPEISYVIDRDYDAGEQIFITYGLKDVMLFALNYNYFDSSNSHVLDFAARTSPVIGSPAQHEIANYASQLYKVNIAKIGSHQRMIILEREMYMLENGPNKKLLDYFSRLGFQTLQELQTKRCNPMSSAKSYLENVESFLEANQYAAYDRDALPAKLRRFHDALAKERKILIANQEWAKKRIEAIGQVAISK